MTTRVEVRGEMFKWARERARADVEYLTRRFPRLSQWESGQTKPTLKQIEQYAHATHTPVGFFFLSEPPEEQVPLPDFRTLRDVVLRRPSADLLDTVFLCEQRQEWYRDFARANGESALPFVGSLNLNASVVEAASIIRGALNFDVGARGSSWGEAFRRFADKAENLGVLVMVNGIVGNNTRRKLDPREFRGFAMVDEVAPLVFVNGADTKAAQIFSLAHELTHVWVGRSALSDVDVGLTPQNEVERWCNEVAAELLVPMGLIQESFDPGRSLPEEVQRQARQFRVSTLVILRRLHDVGSLGAEEFRVAYAEERDRVMALVGASSTAGGNFYNTQSTRVGKRFARAVVSSAAEGQTLYRDALRMLGIKKLSTFHEFSRHLGVA